MKFLIFHITNNTNAVQDVDLNNISDNIEFTSEEKEISVSEFDGLKIITTLGSKVDNCFLNKSITINDVEIHIPEWFNMTQHTNDYVHIGLRVVFDSLCFKLNPYKSIELRIPSDRCTFGKITEKNISHEQ